MNCARRSWQLPAFGSKIFSFVFRSLKLNRFLSPVGEAGNLMPLNRHKMPTPSTSFLHCAQNLKGVKNHLFFPLRYLSSSALFTFFLAFSLRNLLECVVGDDALQSFQFEGVSGRHDVVVVDHLNEWLDFGSLLDSLLAHATSDFRRVALNACDQSVGEWVLLGALVDWLNDDDLLSGISASSNDGHTADLEKLHLEVRTALCSPC